MVFQLSSRVRTHGKVAGSRNGVVGTREARMMRRSNSCSRRAPISLRTSMTRSLMRRLDQLGVQDDVDRGERLGHRAVGLGRLRLFLERGLVDAGHLGFCA